MEYETHDVLIWGKTTPELSTKHYETVCTGGVLEDGRYVRLYPIPFRFLEDKFSKYQMVRLRIKKSNGDSRPESHSVEPGSIEVLDAHFDTSPKGLAHRSLYMFRDPTYLVGSVEELLHRQKTVGQSIGMVKVREILRISHESRTDDEKAKFQRKLEELRERQKQQRIFEEEADLAVLDNARFREHTIIVHWYCHDPNCNGHKMSCLDWEFSALIWREGIEEAVGYVEYVLRRSLPHLHFILGNLKGHPRSFVIGGYWKWPIANQGSLDL